MDPRLELFMRNSQWAKPADSYMTNLPPEQEAAFNQWAAANQRRIGPPAVVNDPMGDYDYRGWWQENGSGGGAPEGHFTDTYKTPYHESFSNESKYANPETAPKWIGDDKKGFKLMSSDGKVLMDESK